MCALCHGSGKLWLNYPYEWHRAAYRGDEPFASWTNADYVACLRRWQRAHDERCRSRWVRFTEALWCLVGALDVHMHEIPCPGCDTSEAFPVDHAAERLELHRRAACYDKEQCAGLTRCPVYPPCWSMEAQSLWR